jgi:hypothetical protein
MNGTTILWPNKRVLLKGSPDEWRIDHVIDQDWIMLWRFDLKSGRRETRRVRWNDVVTT